MLQYGSKYTMGRLAFGVTPQKVRKIIHKCPDVKCQAKLYMPCVATKGTGYYILYTNTKFYQVRMIQMSAVRGIPKDRHYYPTKKGGYVSTSMCSLVSSDLKKTQILMNFCRVRVHY